MNSIDRSLEQQKLEHLLATFPIVAILGARQVGKTTLARKLVADTKHFWFDLENPADLARLEDPLLTLSSLQGLVVLDEVQRLPEIFPLLRVLADRPGHPARFLLLGSASPKLLKQSSESLAGRIAYHELSGFQLDEVGAETAPKLWLRGGFPRSFLAASENDSAQWREQFLRIFLERDLPQLGITIPAQTLRRFWNMLAHWHGQVWNASEFARSFGISDATVRRYLDLLTDALVVKQLQPWHANLAKRQVKAPKIYLADSGLLHTLLGLTTDTDLFGHPKLGASWEGFVLNSVIRQLGARNDEAWFWASHAGAELDLLIVRGSQKLGFEIKRTSTPRTTKSMHAARESLGLDTITLIHAGENSYPLAEGIQAMAFSRMHDELEALAAG